MLGGSKWAWLPKTAQLRLTGGFWGRIPTLGSPDSLWAPSPDLFKFAAYPQLEASALVLRTLEPFVRIRLPVVWGELPMPRNATALLPFSEQLEVGLYVHW